jgi:hypothetical protein
MLLTSPDKPAEYGFSWEERIALLKKVIPMPRPSFSPRIVIPAILTLLASGTAAIVGLSLVAARESPSIESAWRGHRKACLKIPEEVFHKDRSRAVRGVVHDKAGKPVPGGLVRCVRMATLFERAQGGPPTPTLWSGLVEAETRTNPEGLYEFPYLAEGSRMICVSAPGLAPGSQGPFLVQDGTGARVDFTLDAPEMLRVRLKDVDDRPRTVYLVPYRWWPEFVSRDLGRGETEVEFPGLGGSFRKGLVLVSDRSRPLDWKVIDTFNLDLSREITVSLNAGEPRPSLTIPEAGSVASWQPDVTETGRLFFGMLSPIALFQSPGVTSKSSVIGFRGGPAKGQSQGGLRGYARGAFLPVLIESRDGGSWLAWTSDASEFELTAVPPGLYRARSLNSFGQISFARALIVTPSGVAELATGLGDPVQLDEPLSREVMGIVRTEDGRPVESAEVFLQDATNFRRFLQRVVTDRNGFFRISNVPGNSQYFAFAMPPKDGQAMKDLIYPRVDPLRRETWLDLSLSPHRIVGRLTGADVKKRLELVREDLGDQKRVVWMVDPSDDGQFEITNVPHGRYVIRAVDEKSTANTASLPIVVDREFTVVAHWPESQ